MSKISAFLSKWTPIDVLLSPYSQATFERVAHKYGLRRRGCGVLAIVSGVMAVGFLLGSCALSTLIAKQFYLDAYGTEAVATVTNVSFTTTKSRGTLTHWKKIEYEFTNREGRRIKNVLNRPVSELAGLPGGKRLTAVYWERFPSINLPRGARADVLGITTVALIFLLCTVQFGCLSRRFFIWRRHLIAAQLPA